MRLPLASFAVLFAAAAAAAHAHEIPTAAQVRLLLYPEGSGSNNTMHLLARVPLRAIRDIEFPVHGPGYLDVDKLAPLLPEAASLWIAGFIDLRENGARLDRPRLAALRLSLESDRSFAAIDSARAHFSAPPLTNADNVLAPQLWLDVHYEYRIASPASAFSLRPGLAHLAARVSTVLLFRAANGVERVYEFEGDPGQVPLDPRWSQAARRFIEMGFLHILDGVDHLLFLACLVIPVRRLAPLAWVVTGFTIAHSVTLLASAYGLAPGALWFPPLIETLIAASIVFMAIENIVTAGSPSPSRRRFAYAFAFGLVHGFGFSFALRQTLQFAGGHLVTSLFAFNLGVELGQLAALAVFVPLLALLFRYVFDERLGTIVLSAFIAHSGWHWMTERGQQLLRYSLAWPEPDAAFLASLMRWAIAALVLGALAHRFRQR